MSKKVKVDNGLIEKAKEVFEKAGGRGIFINEGLNRKELRALERRGYVRKITTFGKQKYSGVTGSIMYLWQWDEIATGLVKEVKE